LAYAIVTPAFSASGLAVYHEDGLSDLFGGSVEVTAGPIKYTTASSEDQIATTLLQFGWSVVLESKKEGTNEPWSATETQPNWDNINVPGI
jgi:hypothetical protein